jgi:Fe-S-cluster containining protein
MRCSHCGICCTKTEMLLSIMDIELLEKAGHDRGEYVHLDKKGYAKLQNRNGYCVFYDSAKQRCKVYEHRPSGCRIYPVIYSEEDGVILDNLCPEKNTVSADELKRKGMKVVKLLDRMDSEAETRKRQIPP